MYSNQGGKALELFTAHGKDPLSKVRMVGGRTIKKEFDSIIKGYVLSLTGSPATTHIHLPKLERKGLGLSHLSLLLQIYIPQDAKMLIELIMLDTKHTKRKFHLSPWQQGPSVTPLTVKLHLPALLNQWQWLVINLNDLMRTTLHQTYQSLETISVCGYCKIRCIAALRDEDVSLGDIPSSWQPPPSTRPLELLMIDSTNVLVEPKKDGDVPKHVAFGEKITIPHHVLSQQLLIANRTRSQEMIKQPIVHEPLSLIPIPPEPQNLIPIPSENPIPIPMKDPIPVKSSKTKSPISNHTENPIPIPESENPIPMPTSQRQVPMPSVAMGTGPFSYTSPPHSASQHSQTSRHSNTLDSDFISLNDKYYQWEDYHSEESDDEAPPIMITKDMPSPRDDMDGSLDVTELPLHDHINTDNMGGPLTPPTNDTPTSNQISSATQDEDKLELLYDPDLNYFYDPKTDKYYQLTN